MKIGIDYCPNPASKEFQELKSIFGEAKAYLLWDRNHGNPLDMAPNGAQSKLFQTYLGLFNGDREKALVAKSKVYSDEFFNWFGDWIEGLETNSINFESVPAQLIRHLKSSGINVYGRNKMQQYLQQYSDRLAQLFIGKKARTQFEQQLIKARPDLATEYYKLPGTEGLLTKWGTAVVWRNPNDADMNNLVKEGYLKENSDGILDITEKGKAAATIVRPDIDEVLDFLHSLEDNKENTAYIKTAIRWIANRSITLPQDQTKAYQAFELARKKHIDLQKYNTLGELIAAPEMQPKEKEKKAFNPDTAKTFSNKRTVTTEGGRVFTVYDVEDTDEGQREVCKALAAHYKMSPWCLSTFTAKGEPTESAKNYWNIYNAVPRKIAFENGKPVAFNSGKLSDLKYSFNGFDVDYTPNREYNGSRYELRLPFLDPNKLNKDTSKKIEELLKKGIISNVYEGLEDEYYPTYVINKEYTDRINKTTDAWWDMEDRYPQNTLSDSIVSDSHRAHNFFDADGQFEPEPFEPEPFEPDPVEMYTADVINAARRILNDYVLAYIRDNNLVPDGMNEIWVRNLLVDRYLEEGTIANVLLNDQNLTGTSFEIAQIILARLNIFDHIVDTINSYIEDLPQAAPVPVNPNQIELEDDDMPFFMTPNGEVYGFVTQNGDIYLDEEIISPEHPIHEYTHLWDRIVSKQNPELWQRGVELMKQTQEWNNILNDSNYGKKWQSDDNISKEQLEFLIASEVHARLTGKYGEQILNDIANQNGSENIVDKLRQWILDFWKDLKRTFSNWSEEDLQKLTIEDFNKMTVRDFIELDKNSVSAASLDTTGVTKTVQSNGKIRLSLDSHTNEHPRQIVLEPQGDNKFYVHIRIWDGDKIPGEISNEDKQKLFNALYNELPIGAEILLPKSGKGYYATRGTVAAMIRLSRDNRFKKGTPGVVQYKDGEEIKQYSGTSFIKRDTDSVSKVVDENGEPLLDSIYDSYYIKQQQNPIGKEIADNDIQYRLLKSKVEYTEKLLKAEGLVHRWSANGGKSILFAKRTYDIAGNTHYPEQEIKDICKKTGVGYSLYESPSGKSMIVNLYDRIESASKNPAIPEVVLNLAQKLSNKFPGLTFKIVDEQDVPRNVRKNACCWTRGGIIYLINGRVTEEMTIEEFLHPFVSILQKYNPDYFYELVKEIKKLYPSLIKNIDAVYSDFEGFDQDTRDNEYVAQGLAKAMHESKHKNEKVLDILKSFGQWFIELLKSFSEYWWHGYAKGSVYTIDPMKIKNLTVGELARLLNADDIEVDLSNYDGNKKTYYHMADPNATIEDISAEINKQFKILYDAYRKIPNKTEQQQRVQNKVFENLTQLRAQRDVTSIQIALKTGLDIIGTVDYNTGLPGDPNSVLGKLYALEQSTVPYSTATAKELVEMYRNSIGFFKSMLSDIPDSFYSLTTDANLAIALKKMRDDLQNRLNEANNKWKVALVSVTDKIVEEQIDAEVSLSQDVKDDMKTVYKDWLHTNLYYGDISTASSLLVNYGQNNNPIIRLAFHMIQRAESKIQFESQPISVKITKQYQRAQKEHYLQPDWQTIYMEFDKDGIPTGKWVRDINYGQYAKDVNEFIDKLNEEFLQKYKFYYILDDNDVLVNSATLQRGDEEEWVGNTEPPYVEYMRRIEQYKCSRAYRRYTYDYYKERFSRPYSQSYPSGHGLSPRTLSKYNRIQSNINYYLDLCTDKITGLHHPENLSDENKKKLDLWKHELDKLSDVFDEDGWLKTDEDLQMAEEIRAWESWIGEKMVTQTDLDLFLQERAEIETRVQNGEIPPKILTDFDRYNATFGINQDFINQTIGQFDNPKGEPSDVVEARMRRRCIADMVKLPFNKLDRDMSNFEDKKQLWVYQKLYDQTVEDGRVTRSKDMAEEFDKNFFMKDVLYRDENGYAVDTQGNIVQPQDESSRRDLLTFYEYMVQKYTDEALSNGTIAGLVDLQGNVYHFSGSRDEIESQVRELLSYTRRYTDAEGNLVEEQVPLTIFKVMYPRQDTFYNVRTGRTENTLEYVPTGRFSYKTDNWANTSVKYVEDPANYDRTSLQAEQPKRQYYDNSEQYKKATSGETGKLYDMLIQQMKDSQQDYNFGNPIFDYNLPQINATNAAVLSRCLRNGVGATLKYISDSINTVQENDDDMRSTKSGVVNPDGTFATDVPRRYINPLKDPATITHNITGAVMMYMHAAKNYKYKTIIEGQLEALRYAMDDDNREKDAVSVQHSKTTFDSMMDKHMYGNQWGNRNLNSQSGYDVARQKTLRNAHRLESVQMLGLNVVSMTVGGSDSICKMFRDAIAAKHFSVRDLITGITSTLLHLPLLILNLGNPVANNKQVGVNQLFGIGKDYKMIYEHQDYGRTRKFVTNLLMGGYSMIDYVNNSILLRSNLSGIRFYNGNKIPKGFYTKWEMQQAFVQAGYSIYQGTLAHMCCTKTLWGAIKYKHGYTWISDDYSQYVSEKIMSDVRTRTLQRGGLYNGMNPDNDIPRYKQSVLWAIPLAMRAWLLQQWQHLFLGLDDTSVREFYEKDEESRKGLFKKRRTRRYMKKRTDEQRANRLTWNFETGVPQDEIGNGLSRSFVTLMKKLYAFVTLNKQKLKNVKFSYVEKYAVRDTLVTLALIHALMITWIDVHHWASSAYQYKPENRQQASLEYQMQHFFDHDTYKMFIDDIHFRTIEAQLSGVNPATVSDILNSITVLKSGVTEHMGLLKSAADLSGLSGKDLSEEVIRGKYKYFSRGERSAYQFFGPLDNLYTSFTFQGLYNNELYYWNAYGAPIRSLYGYDFKQELKQQEGIFNRPVIKRPTINRPVINRPIIKRPTIR